MTEVFTPADGQEVRPHALIHVAGHTALVIDDQEEARELLGHALREVGMQVVEARSIVDALERASTVRPDVITLDLLMPEGGIEGIDRLIGDPSLGGIPIVVVSVVADEYRTRLPQAAAFLTKPVDRFELLETLAQLLPA
ncbi:MAG: response regulator [Thermoanaerobaculia bacterium]|nr:response regulator [Thermoanaerobaculia bacterium]